MHNLLREPVLQFALFGAALFIWFSLGEDPAPAMSEPELSSEIIISDGEVRRLIEQFKAVWHRRPTPKELTALVEAQVREEVLVREALALGLDRGDAAIRNRLRQKMAFLIESAAQMLDPSEEILITFMNDNREQFAQEARIAFEQIYLGERVGQDVVTQTLEQLEQGVDPQTLGRVGLLPPAVSLAREQQVTGTFGTGVFEVLKEAKTGVWFGPVRSGYGVHLVRVTDMQPAALPEFRTVRQAVLVEWQRVESKALAEQQYETIKATYQVTTPDAAALTQALTE